MNHKYDIDWLAGWIICQRLGIIQVIFAANSFVRIQFLYQLGIENRW